MYKCECGCVFDEPKYIEEYQGECWGVPAYETWAVCPDCGDTCFDEYDPYAEEDEEDEEYEEGDE